jgi:hypothetical protein
MNEDQRQKTNPSLPPGSAQARAEPARANPPAPDGRYSVEIVFRIVASDGPVVDHTVSGVCAGATGAHWEPLMARRVAALADGLADAVKTIANCWMAGREAKRAGKEAE